MPTGSATIAQPRKQRSTLQLLRAARLVLLLLDVLLLMAVVSATEAHQAALQTLGRDAAPSIIAAQHIKTAVAGMDAQLATQLITNGENSAASLSRYNAQRAEAATSLLNAAENITYGDAERAPIRILQNGLALYEELAERSRDLHDLERSSGTANSGAVLNAYREAESMTDQSLLPAADELDSVNNNVLERSYRSDQRRSEWTRFLIVVAALTTLAVLVATQMMLSQRMHRTFNPAMLIATLLVIALCLHALNSLAASHRELKLAKENAFHSVRALWQARGAAFLASSEANRALLDIPNTAADQRSFVSEAEALAHRPADLSTDQLVAALREGRQVQGFTGFLADDLNNSTFPGEREAVLETLGDWQAYVAGEQAALHLDHSGQRRRAVELATNTQNGGSQWAFEQFDRALGSALTVSQGAFNTAVDSGFNALRGLEGEAVAAALFIAALLFLGFAPRLREYR